MIDLQRGREEEGRGEAIEGVSLEGGRREEERREEERREERREEERREEESFLSLSKNINTMGMGWEGQASLGWPPQTKISSFCHPPDLCRIENICFVLVNDNETWKKEKKKKNPNFINFSKVRLPSLICDFR